jgi:hypothetical protein
LKTVVNFYCCPQNLGTVDKNMALRVNKRLRVCLKKQIWKENGRKSSPLICRPGLPYGPVLVPYSHEPLEGAGLRER